MFKKICSIGGALALALAASLAIVAVPVAAQAAAPLVTGSASCNPDTSQVDITWTVVGDANIPEATATVVSEQLNSDAGDVQALSSSLVGQQLGGGGSLQAVQHGATPAANYSLTVGVQWSDQEATDVVLQQSAPVHAEDAGCAVPAAAVPATPEPAAPEPSAPEPASPEASTPEVSAPEAPAPESSAPEVSIPDVSTHQQSRSTKADASASVSLSEATCDAASSLTLDKPVNARWGDVSYDGDSYSVTATASRHHRFPDGPGVTGHGSKMLFEGLIEPQKTGAECAPPPACIPSTAVSYTYDRVTSSGIITVAQVPSISGALCSGFWVTAASWKYKTSAIWPQSLDQLDFVNDSQQITLPGEYPFQAVMSCGQGDIYASYSEQPVPTKVLTGPNRPYKEFFLHQMGFTGPYPTWYNQPPGCNTVKAVAPTVTASSQCGVASSVVAGPTTGVEYMVDFDPNTGMYVVTATPAANYVFAHDRDQKVTFTGTTAPLIECIELPSVTAFGTCATDAPAPRSALAAARVAGLAAQVAHLTFDNSRSTGPVVFEVIGFPEFNRTVPAGEIVKLEILDSTQGGSSYTVTASGHTFVLPIPSCQLPTQALVSPTYSMTRATCTTGGTFRLGSIGGDVVWTVNGRPSVSNGTYRAPTDFSDVTIVATPVEAGDGLDPDWVNPLVLDFSAPGKACTFDPPTLSLPTLGLSSFDPPTLAYTGSSATPGAALPIGGGLLFVGIAVLFLSRRRRPEAE